MSKMIRGADVNKRAFVDVRRLSLILRCGALRVAGNALAQALS